MKQRETRRVAAYVYGLLLNLYPRRHRQEYGPLMLQAFKDAYQDIEEGEGRVPPIFWLAVIADEAQSMLSEHLLSLREGNIIQRLWKRQGVFFGLLLGILALVAIVWVNVLVPGIGAEDQFVIIPIVVALLLLLFLTLVGMCASYRTTRLLSGTSAGVITALFGCSIACCTFFVIDNIWFNLVSHHVDKIYGFRHSTFPTMRDYINNRLLIGTVVVLPLMAGVGAMCGTLGAILGKLLAFKRKV